MISDPVFFDAWTRIGPRKTKHSAEAWTLEHLLEEMDHCSVSGALVASTQSLSYDAQFGNAKLSEAIKPFPFLHAIWNVIPHQTGEFPAPEELGRQMRDQNVRAVTLCPRSNAWDWAADHARPLLEWLAENALLSLVDRSEFTHYRELDLFLAANPRLPVLLTGAVWSEQRLVLPLLHKHRNLHLSFEKFQIHYGIEHLVETGLEDRILFASNAPTMSMGAHRCFIDYADIPPEAKAKAAGGNLVRLLKGQEPGRTQVNREEDAIMTAARKGEPLPVPLIDMHMHILHEGMNGAGEHYRMDRGGPSGVFALLKRLGCQGGGFMSWSGPVSCDSVGGNECTRLALDTAPQGYWGLGTFDPVHYSPGEMLRQIHEVYADRRFIGMKPYVRFGVEYHHAPYDPWWEYGNKHRFYAIIHRVRNDFLEVETLAAKYPNVRWVVAHCGSDFRTADLAIAAMKKHPNIFAEITLTPVPLGIVDYLVKHAGSDRVLYGSDLPMRDPRQQLGWVVFSRLGLEEKKNVLAANAMRVIQPVWDRLPAHSRPRFASAPATAPRP
jgi:predicted TIM-barrel fold metal-dependent hydrolase